MRWPRYLLLVLLPLGCKPADSDIEPRKVSGPKQSPTLDDEPSTGVPLAAAGVEITVPSDWTILTEDDPNFALAFVHEPGSSYMPVCSVELRRQGPGSLPDTNWHKVKLVWSGKTGEVNVTVDGQTTGALRGIDLSLKSGKIGLGSFFETAQFRNLKVIHGS